MKRRTPRNLEEANLRRTRLALLVPALTAFVIAGTLVLAAASRPPVDSRGGAPGTPYPKLTYTRVLKGSIPEYLTISVDAMGTGTYEGRKLDEPPSPRAMKLSAATTGRLFGLARALNDFKDIDLESHKKVANLGSKTVIYQAGDEKYKVEFNYTLNRQAQELVDLFEKIAAVEQHIDALEYEVKYDHLGLPRELLQIQIDLDNKALADPQLMVPTLDEIVKNPRFLHLAQVRAQNILERLQNSN
ncbi:MAG TPA: hypothetical protein VG204_08825 [Terriglobia bacterium]|nr:hypothetical protein [Terriglobia bacterium]